MNKLDDKLQTLAADYFTALGLETSLAQFKTKELMICADRGYNTRAELISLVKNASKAVQS